MNQCPGSLHDFDNGPIIRRFHRRAAARRSFGPWRPRPGESDDITTKEQVFDAEKYLGTPKRRIVTKLVPGGHIGLFMGSRTLQEA